MAIVSVEHLKKSYIQGGRELKAVDDISFSVERGQVMLIMGPSGSGKTTLVSIIGALLSPDGGNIKINGVDMWSLSKKELANKRLHTIGFIFQNFNLLTSLTAVENVEVVGILAGHNRRQARKKAFEVLTQLGLAQRAKHYPKQLSGGEQQRVSIARALMNEPDIILADEPTGNLDSQTGKDVMTLLCSISCQQKRGVIIVTHDLRLREIADKILWIEDGKIIKEETITHTTPKLGAKKTL